jgi:hypothetical protein
MAYVQVLNNRQSLSPSEVQDMVREFNLLRAEMDDMRTKYTALVALLAAATSLGAGYNTGTALAARQFLPT